MKTYLFDYDLPEELIAKYPAVPRHSAKLMILYRKEKKIVHDIFWNLPDYLSPGDLLVFNDTKVLPARIKGNKDTGGKVEVLLTDRIRDNQWKAFVGGKKIKPGLRITVANDFKIEVIEHLEGGIFIVRLLGDDIPRLLDRYGKIPIPPYIKREEEDIDREYYQTIFAKEDGSVASPTASLHFSQELMERLTKRGILHTFITLHVSYGTFKPISSENIEKHRVDPEYVRITPEAVRAIKETKKRGNRVVCVGTTVVRSLETRPLKPFEGWTDLYIKPGFRFQVTDAMITNFHLPRSSLLVLVSAFAGRELIMEAYRIAIKKQYRFYSYGDGMLIL